MRSTSRSAWRISSTDSSYSCLASLAIPQFFEHAGMQEILVDRRQLVFQHVVQYCDDLLVALHFFSPMPPYMAFQQGIAEGLYGLKHRNGKANKLSIHKLYLREVFIFICRIYAKVSHYLSHITGIENETSYHTNGLDFGLMSSSRHARTCSGHPCGRSVKVVERDARNKSGHDGRGRSFRRASKPEWVPINDRWYHPCAAVPESRGRPLSERRHNLFGDAAHAVGGLLLRSGRCRHWSRP